MVEETLDCGRGSLVGKDVTVTKVNSCVPRSQVYPIFCRTPLKYPPKTFNQRAGMEVVGHVLLRLQRHWLVTAALSKWLKKYWTVVVGHCLGRM